MRKPPPDINVPAWVTRWIEAILIALFVAALLFIIFDRGAQLLP